MRANLEVELERVLEERSNFFKEHRVEVHRKAFDVHYQDWGERLERPHATCVHIILALVTTITLNLVSLQKQ